MTKKTVLISGAASGIGSATVQNYIKTTDHQIIAIDKDCNGLTVLKEMFSELERQRLITVTIDLTSIEQVKLIMTELLENRMLDHVIISHGVGYENLVTDNEKWDHIFSINILSVQRLFSLLDNKINDEGRVVMVSSVLGRVGKAANSAYVTSKHALLGLTKSLALDWAPRKITVNAVLPCWVDTPMLHAELQPQANMIGVPSKQLIRKIKKRIPLRQLIKPSDVANSILFLTSSAASMITAQSIVIDGGYGCGI